MKTKTADTGKIIGLPMIAPEAALVITDPQNFGKATPVRVWTVAQVARMAGVGNSRIRQLVAQGRFANAVKVAGRVFIPDADLQAYLAWPDRRTKPPGQLALPGVNEVDT